MKLTHAEQMGRSIRQLRRARYLPQGKVASLLGITQSRLARIEAGKIDMYVYELVLFAKIFSVTPEFILAGKREFL